MQAALFLACQGAGLQEGKLLDVGVSEAEF